MEQKLLASDDPAGEATDPILDSLFGIDIDKNAVAAASLSLALLHLAARGRLPEDVPIVHGDALDYVALKSESGELYDAVIVNPPFVRTELQSSEVRQAIAQRAGIAAKGKLDTYLAFLTLSIQSLRPGGFGCFVVPQTLLTSDNLKSMRDWILERAWIHVVADLSAIRVFKAGVYVALVIVQKKHETDATEPPVTAIRCRQNVGLALDEFLEGNYRRTSSYLIFGSRQATLSRPTWSVPMPEEGNLLDKLEAMPRLSKVAVVRQGAITGADKVFVVDMDEVPSGEEMIYRPFLPEKMIGRYTLPKETGKRILYPYIGGAPVGTSQLKADFPVTWERLNLHRDILSSRRSAPSDPDEWWRPSRPRPPSEMLAPKIVGPKLFLMPRYGIDMRGQWIVSHSPLVRCRSGEKDEELLFILAAVLNSNVVAWFMDLNARKHRYGYSEAAISLLKRLPIPDLNQVPKAVMRHVVESVWELASPSRDYDHARASMLDDTVLRDLYGLTDEDLKVLRPEYPA